MPELADSSASDPVEAARGALDAALAAVTESDFADSIQAVTDEMPVALGVDFANIRVLGLDRRLHLVAASGCTTMEIRRQAFHPLPAAVVREMLASGVRLLAYVADRLREPFTRIDRRGAHLRACSVRLARAATPPEWPAEGPVANLRRRERQILELYADGLSTGDIAELLVISPHTVRTHVKLALRRLGVHQRDEAAAMVRADQVVQLI